MLKYNILICLWILKQVQNDDTKYCHAELVSASTPSPAWALPEDLNIPRMRR